MFKLLLCIFLVLVTTMLGVISSHKLSVRRKTLESIVNSVIKMKSMINFSTYEIDRVICECFSDIYGFEMFSQSMGDYDDFVSCWNNRVSSLPDELCLDSEDKELLRKFAENLGITDLQGQTDNCVLYCELFKDRLEGAKEKEKSSGRLYKILGFSLGCVITLMIV